MFRFTIRDVLWLTVVVALGVAWWLDQAAADRRYRMLEQNVILMSGKGGLIFQEPAKDSRMEADPNP